MSRFVFFLTTALALFTLTGCKPESARVNSVAGDFILALRNNDGAALDATLTQKARQQPLIKMFLDSEKKPNTASDGYTIRQTTVEGDNATVAIDFKDEKGNTIPGNLQLRRENNAWKVYALTFTGDGKTLTFDFEDPTRIIGDVFRAAGEEAGKAAAALAKGMEGFAKGWNEGLSNNAPPSR